MKNRWTIVVDGPAFVAWRESLGTAAKDLLAPEIYPALCSVMPIYDGKQVNLHTVWVAWIEAQVLLDATHPLARQKVSSDYPLPRVFVGK